LCHEIREIELQGKTEMSDSRQTKASYAITVPKKLLCSGYEKWIIYIAYGLKCHARYISFPTNARYITFPTNVHKPSNVYYPDAYTT